MGTITIEIDESDALVRHNDSLQAALTKRNATIEALQARIDAGEESPLIAAAYERGRKEGWQACANSLMETTRVAAQGLAAVRKDAFDVYLRSEGKHWESVTTSMDVAP